MLGEGDLRARHRVAFNLLWLFEHCAGEAVGQKVFGGVRRRLEAGITEDLAEKGPGQIRPIDRRRDLSPEAFFEEYVGPNRPVVLEGAAADWSCLEWTPQLLAERYPDDEVLLINASPEDVSHPDFDSGRTTLSTLVSEMGEGSLRYARFNPLLQEHPELRGQLDEDWLRARANRLRTGESLQLFMGGGGTTTAIHNAISNNLFVQIHGEKRWLIFPPVYSPIFDPPLLRAPYFFSEIDPSAPDLERFPLFAHLDGYEAQLRPGDVLFNPSFYWHWVTNTCDSIGVGFRWFAPWNIGRSSLTQALLTMLSTNPPIWVARRHRQNFSRIFSSTRAPRPQLRRRGTGR